MHGGDLDEISRIYGIKKDSIINFSGNVNPLGLPHSVSEAIKNNTDICTNYPDVSYLELRKAIAHYINNSFEHIIVGNGSTELISGFIKFTNPENAVVVSPAYSEYLKTINSVGGKTTLFELREENDFVLNTDELLSTLNQDTDLLVICNPNNPTGSYITTDELDVIVGYCKQYSINVMIDETYVEFCDKSVSLSAIPLTDSYDNLFIIRGTSKFFACPGLRLGYGVCSNKETLKYINDQKDLWSVNVFADLAGRTMFTDREFIDSTIELISTERSNFIAEINKLKSIKLYKTQSNFFLAKIIDDHINSDYIFNHLIKEGILIRNCKDFPYLNDKFFRFCILDKKHNQQLIDELKNLFN